MDKTACMREAHSDISKSVCDQLYDAVLLGDLLLIGRLYAQAVDQAVTSHNDENIDPAEREIDAEIDRRIAMER